MVNKNIKIYLILIVIREMQIETMMKYFFVPIRLAKSIKMW